MTEIARAEKVLFKVLADLREYLPDLVLVGGWIPHLYRTLVWKTDSRPPHSTVDIDFGVSPRVGRLPASTVYSKLRRLGYGESHLKFNRPFPIVPTIKLSPREEAFPIEFIASPGTKSSELEKLIGRQIHINRLKYFEILTEDPLRLSVGGIPDVRIPREANYVWHKLLTFPLREETGGKSKDLYYLYYVLRFSPNIEQLTGDLARLRTRKTQAQAVGKNIDKYFPDPLGEGVLLTEREFGPDYIVDDLRQDIYQRLTEAGNIEE